MKRARDTLRGWRAATGGLSGAAMFDRRPQARGRCRTVTSWFVGFAPSPKTRRSRLLVLLEDQLVRRQIGQRIELCRAPESQIAGQHSLAAPDLVGVQDKDVARVSGFRGCSLLELLAWALLDLDPPTLAFLGRGLPWGGRCCSLGVRRLVRVLFRSRHGCFGSADGGNVVCRQSQ